MVKHPAIERAEALLARAIATRGIAQEYREALKSLLPLAKRGAPPQTESRAQLEAERDEARACARVLVHAFCNNNRPPDDVVNRALAYPVSPKGGG